MAEAGAMRFDFARLFENLFNEWAASVNLVTVACQTSSDVEGSGKARAMFKPMIQLSDSEDSSMGYDDSVDTLENENASVVFGEIVLFCMGFTVNQKADGRFT